MEVELQALHGEKAKSREQRAQSRDVRRETVFPPVPGLATEGPKQRRCLRHPCGAGVAETGSTCNTANLG